MVSIRVSRWIVGPLVASVWGCAGSGTDGVEPEELGAPVALLDHIVPTIGTGGIGFQVGGAYPGATRPLGMVALSPDTVMASGLLLGAYHTGGYHYDDDAIRAFSHMHLNGPGIPDYGLVGVMPTDGFFDAEGLPRLEEERYRATFSHENEHAEAGLYQVVLDEPAIEVSLTATLRTGLHRYVFPEDVVEPTLIFSLSHTVGLSVIPDAALSIDPETGRIEGRMRNHGELGSDFTLWFVAEPDTSPSSVGLWQDGVVLEDTLQIEATTEDAGLPEDEVEWEEAESVDLGGWLSFDTREVGLRVAISPVDLEGARANFEAEHTGFSIDEDLAAARTDWTRILDAVRVWGGTEEERQIFATALYRSMVMPNLFSDVDGRYTGFDQQIHTSEFDWYTDFSLWDTYRTTHPLYTLLWPDRHRDLLRSFVPMVEQGGALPRWPLATWDGGFMVGVPAQIVIAEAVLKGIEGFDAQVLIDKAVEMALTDSEYEYGNRPYPSYLDTYGYYPSDEVGRSVAWNLEAAIADHTLSLLDESRVDPADSDVLAAHARTWRNLYDPAVGFFHARQTDGSFETLGSESIWADEYAEGNARQYLWLVPQDVAGLVDVLGGTDAAAARLEEFFDNTVLYDDEIVEGAPKQWYWHGNEVDIHAPWLFAAMNRPDLAYRWVRWTMETWYSTAGDGLAGNDDGGTLSAWYAWAAMGIYPLAGTDRYLLTTPLFDQIEIELSDGVFTITRDADAAPVRVLLNGEALDDWELTHDQIRGGSCLHFESE